MVVDHIAGTRRRIFAGYDDYDEQATLQMPLLWVCHSFRAVVYSRFSRYHGFGLDSGMNTILLTRCSWPFHLEQANYQTPHLTKDLEIEVDIWSIYSGKSSELLSNVPNKDLVFPLVRSLSFLFIVSTLRNQIVTTSMQNIDANISEFVLRIKRMVPLATEIKIETATYSHDVHPSICHHFTSLVSQLYQLTDCVARRSLCCAVPFWQQSDLVSSITHFGDQDYNISESIMQLVRQSALTLQTLDISLEESDVTGLIQDANGGYVCYSHLQTLYLTMLSNCTDVPRLMFTGATPFPILRRLKISDQYPFGDDTPLRSNAGTLEFLKINIDAESVKAFTRHNVFTPISHPKLQCLKIGLMPNLASEHFGSEDACMQFILGIAPNVAVLEIISIQCDQGLPDALPLLYNHAQVQVLELPTIDINLWDAITLIKSLPALSDLRTMAPTLDHVPTDTTLLKLPIYVLSTYGIINERFWCWNLNMRRAGIPKDTARCVLLLALICPSLDFVLPPVARHATFTSQMRKLIATNGFKKYEPRLQRLLFDRLRL
ncbi:hypothetical protein H4S07_004672 [Coemansia furcata]|uniref:Uncharacterized protein n=1 Tax=Coemansia furcata TaxID=417177 RepID=A0ACC1L7R0_9FUNG|nr:hypothetical protein H4S07_004672 [Coemansia furcata]